MKLNKIYYNVVKKIKKAELVFYNIENLNLIKVPHKLFSFNISELLDIQEYANLYFDSEFYNIENEEIERLDFNDIVDDIVNKIVEDYMDKIYDIIPSVPLYNNNTKNYFLYLKYNKETIDNAKQIFEYFYDDLNTMSFILKK